MVETTRSGAVTADIPDGSAQVDPTLELRLSEARYRTLVLATALDVWHADDAGNLVSDIPNWRAHTRQDGGSVQGWGWLDGVHPDHRDRVRAAWTRAAATGEPYECEYPIVGPDGDERIVLARGYPIRDGDRILEWVGVATDITEQRRASQRLADLQRLTAGLAVARDVDDVAALVVEGGRLALGSARASLYIAEPAGTHVRLVAASGFDPAFLPRVERMALDVRYPATDALRSAEPVVLRSVAEWEARYPHLGTDDHQSTAVVATPMQVGDRAVGSVTFGWDAERALDDGALQLVESLADLGAQALDRARLYEVERETSLTLQRSLLPPRPPSVPGMEVAARYRPGIHTVAVGGDFYDVFRLAPNAWGIAIGDVCGKGAAAAGLTALARYTLRAAATHHTAPTDVLRELNTAVLNEPETDTRFCSAVFARLELDRCGSWVSLSCAGHPRPYVVRRAGWLDVRGQSGTLLGLFDDPDLSDDLVGLGPGDAVVLVTDGITEARDPEGAMFGEEALPEALMAASQGTAEEIADAVLRAADAFARTELRDDVALLVLRVPTDAAVDPMARLRAALGASADEVLPDYVVPIGDPSRRPLPPREARLRLSEDLSSVARARRFVDGVLHSWRLSDMTAGDAELLVSELATNAIRHAASGFTVLVRFDGTSVRVEVGDGSRERPEQRLPKPEEAGGRGILLVDAVARAWGVTPTLSGKRVWFELDAPPERARADG